MSKAKARVFVPLTKVDEEQRLVYGRITQEMLDKAGEVMDYTTSKPLFEKWSADIHDASGGLSKGNVRVMHGLVAAGKLTELDFNDNDQAIDVCAKIVDDAEWNKVTEGVYTGFSVGGSYEKRWTETIDGQKVKKFTAKPNEVSIVDNPCVPNAVFSMFKADGTEEEIAFQVENDDDLWPGFAKADDGGDAAASDADEPEAPEPVVTSAEPKNEDVAKRATEIALEKADGSTWMDHVEEARNELLKSAGATDEDADDKEPKGKAKKKAKGDDDKEAVESDDEPKAEKVTPAGVKQKWTASDGAAFEKKEDAVAHEEGLLKAAEPQTEAEKLAARLAKAVNPDSAIDVDLMDDYDRLGKAIEALQTPHNEDGSPVLEKGMYTVSRFANVLYDLGSLTRKIAKEGVSEGDDESDKTVSNEMKTAMASLGESFKAYVDNQITELLAGIDDEVCVSTYDYYYAAAQADGDNQLAKDVCSLIESRRDDSRERREVLGKAFGFVSGTLESTELDTDDLPPSLQKRFDELTAENEQFKKVAEEAVEKVEELAKRVQAVEDTPLPRAPRGGHVVEKETEYFGKTVKTSEDKMTVLQEMLAEHGADGLATLMIKAAQNQPQTLSLKQ